MGGVWLRGGFADIQWVGFLWQEEEGLWLAPESNLPKPAVLFFFTAFRNIGIYGYQKDESLQCMLSATLRYYGGACGVSRLCSECTHSSKTASPGGNCSTCFTVIGLDLFYMCGVDWSRLIHWANLPMSVSLCFAVVRLALSVYIQRPPLKTVSAIFWWLVS